MHAPRGPTVEWVIATQFREMEDYGIGPAPTAQGGQITAENPMKVRR